jgi:hypothetical protein
MKKIGVLAGGVVVIIILLVFGYIESENIKLQTRNKDIESENIKLQTKNDFIYEFLYQRQQMDDDLIIPPEDEVEGENEFRNDPIPQEENELEEGIPLIISDERGVIDI